MSTSDALIELPLPVRGLNTDSPHGPNGYSPDMVNYVPGEAGQLRLRQGTKRVADVRTLFAQTPPASENYYDETGGPTGGTAECTDLFPGSPAGWSADTAIPVGYARHGDKFLVSYMDRMDVNWRWYQNYGVDRSQEVNSSTGKSYNTTARHAIRTLYIDLGRDTPAGYWAEQRNPGLFLPREYYFPPSGRSVTMNGLTIWKTPKGVWSSVLGTSDFSGGRLHCWGGRRLDLSPNLPTWDAQIQTPAGGSFTVGMSKFKQVVNTYQLHEGILGRVTDAAPTHGFPDVYRVASANGTLNTYTFQSVYGKDVDAWQSRVASPTMRWSATAPLTGAPYGVDAIEVFQGRLFTMGGKPSTGLLESQLERSFLDKRLRWSAPNTPDYFPEENWIEIEDAPPGPCTGMQALGDSMLIHFASGTVIISGYDEDTFQVQKFHGSYGCVDERATTYHAGRVYWLGSDGLYSWSGSGGPMKDSNMAPGVGVSSWITAHSDDWVPDTLLKLGRSSPVLGSSANSVLVSMPRNYMPLDDDPFLNNPAERIDDNLALNTQSGTWWRYAFPGTQRHGGLEVRSQSSTVKYWNTPYLYLRTSDSKTYAACPGGILRVDQCFEEPRPPGNAPIFGQDLTGFDPSTEPAEDIPRGYARMTPSIDELYTGTSAVPTTYDWQVDGYVTFPALQPQRGVTVRLREIEVDHATLLKGPLPPPISRPPDPVIVTVRSDSSGLTPANDGDIWGQTSEKVNPDGAMLEYNGRMFTKRFRPDDTASGGNADLTAARYLITVSTGIPGYGTPTLTTHRLLGVFVRLKGDVRVGRAQRGGN